MRNNVPSIKRTIIKYGFLSALLVSVVTAWVIYVFIENQSNEQFNLAFESKARTISTLIEQERGELEFNFADEMMPEFEAEIAPEYFEIWLNNGVLLEKSNSLKGGRLPQVDIGLNKLYFRDIDLPDGRPGRLIAWHYLPQVEDDDAEYENVKVDILNGKVIVGDDIYQRYSVTLVLAKSRVELLQFLSKIRWLIITSFTILLLLIYLVLRSSTSIGLRPLEQLSDQVSAINEDSLHQQIALESAHLELMGIAQQVNCLLKRINDAFMREKRFSANVAHELATPISELKSLSFVGAASLKNTELIAGFFKDVDNIAENMKQIVETLYVLHQSEKSRVDKKLCAINANECIQNAIKRTKAVFGEINIEIDWESNNTKSICIYTDKDKLNQILVNLIANATQYREPGTNILIESNLSEGILSIRISNLTNSLSHSDLNHLTEFFWRKEEARSGGLNFGLGLSLIETLCNILDISLDFHLLDDNQFVVEIGNIPMSPILSSSP